MRSILELEITGLDVLLSSPDASQLKSPVTIVSLHSHDTLPILSPSLSTKSMGLERGLKLNQ